MRRVLCVWFPRLAIDRIERREARLREVAFAFVTESGGRVLVGAANARAHTAGISAGMALADARAVCPQLVTRPAEPRADARLLRGLARWMERYSPLIAFDPPHGLFADTAGAAHLFGGETRMIAGIAGGLEELGITVRAALADTPGAAHALAHFGGGCTVVDPGAARAALAPLPVAALRVGEEVVQSCRRLGLRTVADLYPLARASIASRFGLETVSCLDQALGREDEPLNHIRFVAAPRESLHFAEPIALTGDVEAALALALGRLCARLEREDKGVRLAALAIERVDGARQTLTVATTRPSRSPGALLRLFRDRLDRLDAGFGIERLHVEARRCEPLGPEQMTVPDREGMGVADGGLIDRLVNRFGHDRVLRPAPAESHLPERGWTAFSAVDAAGGEAWPLAATARPLCLLTPPEPVAAGDPPAPGRPPASILWKRRTLALTPLSGPERIEPEWWHDDPAWRSGARDYWWVEAEDGERLWLFRAGGPGARGTWFVHGLAG